MLSHKRAWMGCGFVLLLGLTAPPAVAATPLEFRLTFSESVSAAPFTGRVYLMLTKADTKALPAGPNWFKPEPFFARDVKGWRPGETLVFGADALGYPYPLAKLPKGTYTVHAVMDFDSGDRLFSTADGNAHGKPLRREFDPASTGPVALKIDQVYKAKPFVETARVKLVEVESKLLTAFHGRPVRLRAGVVLPASYSKETGKRYPVVYEVPGFGGDHRMAFFAALRNATEVAGVEMLHVVLDPGCRLGHHVFADSANNGPCGRALVEELVPQVEAKFRGLGRPDARFVTGHSSGGWSSLWLQVTYPDFFGGVWSTAPDPVDFRDFQRIDLTRAGANMFTDGAGKPRPLARRGGKPVLWYKDFSDMEEVMGHGGQLASFEAVFSPRGPDGRPRRLWDRATGAVDPEVARSWERYDIRLVLERGWKALGPKLAGKLHVYCGGDDTFYLEGAAALLKQSLAKLGSDAVVEIVPGRDHGTLMDKKMRERIAREMAAQFRRSQQRSQARPVSTRTGE
ncbi:MAG TPA: alpha/beta hydrolase [Gemmataceae bacterium]|nr:alpha/beta hydrolase [Gemmataceae bacterium]